jgi:predicted RNA-binding Zn-ribbon protein involved in translation (DUF1610 family)
VYRNPPYLKTKYFFQRCNRDIRWKKLPYCPSCGKEIEEGTEFCPHCGKNVTTGKRVRRPRDDFGTGITGNLNLAFNLALSKPMVFVPAVLSGIISALLGNISDSISIGVILSLVVAAISFLLNFASIDMSRDAYVGDPLDLMESVNYVLERFVTFLIASIVGAVMSITVILIPVALLMFVILVMDETNLGDSISEAFGVVGRNIGNMLVLFFISVIGFIMLAFVPFVGGLLNACFGVVLNLALMDLYEHDQRDAYR